MEEFRNGITEGDAATKADSGYVSVDEGYSSLEIAAESELETAEPDLEAAARADEEERK